MKQSGWIWKMAMAALMALAVVLVWPPDGSDTASPNVYAAGPASDIHHSHAEEDGHQPGRRVTPDADCMGIGCCAMTHCHPGISADPHEVIAIAVNEETTTSVAVRSSGSAPRVILPPPRRLSLWSFKKSYIQENSR